MGTSPDILLKQYLALAKSGKTAKEVLVEDYLDQVIADCGESNQQVAELVLYLLTDETNKTRPLKTKQELATELSVLAKQGEDAEVKLDLVLRIFSLSGLVFVIPGFPAQRYQLVHDYLVGVILQKQGKSLLRQLQEAEAKRQQAEKERLKILQERDRLFKRAIGGLVTFIAILLGLTGLAFHFAGQSRRQKLIAKAGQIAAKAEWLRSQRGDLHEESVLLAVAAMQRFQKLNLRDVDADVALRDGLTLLPTFVTEVDHQGYVIQVAWSPDGKYLASGSDDNTARVTEVATGQEMARVDQIGRDHD